jgi:hypothetical protein
MGTKLVNRIHRVFWKSITASAQNFAMCIPVRAFTKARKKYSRELPGKSPMKTVSAA